MDSINLEKLQEFLRNKWVLGILSVLLLAVFLPLLLLTERPKQEIVTKKAIIPTVLPIPTTFMANVTSPVTFSSEQLKAMPILKRCRTILIPILQILSMMFWLDLKLY